MLKKMTLAGQLRLFAWNAYSIIALQIWFRRHASSTPLAAIKINMVYQLVLQFKGSSLGDYDAMVAFEDEVQECLSGIAEVDGHDMGCGETNIFIATSNPAAAFERTKPILQKFLLLDDVNAAYRRVSGDSYVVIWPEHSQREFLII